MVARNDITGDAIQTKGSSENYANNYDRIFGKSKPSAMETQYYFITGKVKELMGEAGMVVTFKPFRELIQPDQTISNLYKLCERLSAAN